MLGHRAGPKGRGRLARAVHRSTKLSSNTIKTKQGEQQEARQGHEGSSVTPSFLHFGPCSSQNGNTSGKRHHLARSAPRASAQGWLRTSFLRRPNSTGTARGRGRGGRENKTTTREPFQKRCTKSEHSAERGFLRSESWPAN